MSTETGRITVVGAGGIGANTAAALQLAGEDVQIIDANVAHVDAMRNDGLHVEGIRGAQWVTFDSVLTPSEWDSPADVVLLAVKSQHTADALQALVPRLRADSVVVSLQNGWNALTIAEAVGAGRTVATMLHVVGDFEAPGSVSRHTEGTVYLGELDGSTSPRVAALADRLSVAFPAVAVPNIWGYIWSKQVYGTTMPINALVDQPAQQTYEHDWVKAILLAVLSEGLDAAVAAGVTLEPYERFDPAAFTVDVAPPDAKALLANAPRGSAKGNSGIYQDIKVRHRKTEIEHLTGELVRIGRRHGLAMTVNGRIVEMIGELESGRREMGWDNLTALVEPARAYLRGQPRLAACRPTLERMLDTRTAPASGRPTSDAVSKSN
jgi:2-dehydropantoate 2-reductase